MEWQGYIYCCIIWSDTNVYFKSDYTPLNTVGVSTNRKSGIIYNQYNSETQYIFIVDGDNAWKLPNDLYIVYWGSESPDEGPAESVGSTTGLTGVYSWKVTEVLLEGSTVVYESNPSDASGDVTLSNQSGAVTLVMPPQSIVNNYDLRLYRTLAGGEIYYLSQTIAIGSDYVNTPIKATYDWEIDDGYADGLFHSGYSATFTIDAGFDDMVCTFTWEPTYDTASDTQTTFLPTDTGGYLIVEDIVADTALGSEVETDHNRPPAGTFVFGPNYNGTSFIIKDNLLYYCKPRQIEYWPATYYIEVSPPNEDGVCGVFWNGQPYYLTRRSIYFIQGTGHNTFFPIKTNAVTGAQGIRGACSVASKGIYHIGADGLYLFQNNMDQNVTERAFGPLFRGQTVNGIPAAGDMANAWVIAWKNRVYFGYPSTSATYPDTCLVLYLDTGKWAAFQWQMGEIQIVAIDSTNDRLLGGCADGVVYELEDEDATDDNGTAISWEIESKNFGLQTRRHYPRWVKYDVDASGATSAVGSLMLDGVAHQTHNLTADRDVTRRLSRGGNGRRASIKIAGSGPVEIYAVEAE